MVIVAKVEYNGQIRRFELEEPLSFGPLIRIIVSWFEIGEQEVARASLHYVGADSKMVEICSDMELQNSFRKMLDIHNEGFSGSVGSMRLSKNVFEEATMKSKILRLKLIIKPELAQQVGLARRNVAFKVILEGELRKLGINEPVSLSGLYADVAKVLVLPDDMTMKFEYLDKDGNTKNVANDDNLALAFQSGCAGHRLTFFPNERRIHIKAEIDGEEYTTLYLDPPISLAGLLSDATEALGLGGVMPARFEYVDEDGDVITVGSDPELGQAFQRGCTGHALRFLPSAKASVNDDKLKSLDSIHAPKDKDRRRRMEDRTAQRRHQEEELRRQQQVQIEEEQRRFQQEDERRIQVEERRRRKEEGLRRQEEEQHCLQEQQRRQEEEDSDLARTLQRQEELEVQQEVMPLRKEEAQPDEVVALKDSDGHAAVLMERLTAIDQRVARAGGDGMRPADLERAARLLSLQGVRKESLPTLSESDLRDAGLPEAAVRVIRERARLDGLEQALDAAGLPWAYPAARADAVAALMRSGRTADWLRAGVTEGELAALGLSLGPRRDIAAAFPCPSPARDALPKPAPAAAAALAQSPDPVAAAALAQPQLPPPPPPRVVVRARGSQYTAGGVSACTPMAVEACLQLLLIAADGGGYSEERLGTALEAALAQGLYVRQAHLAPNAVLQQPRYRAVLQEERDQLPLLCGGDATRAAAQQLPLAELVPLLCRLGDAVVGGQRGLSLVLVRPPETVSLTALPAGGGGGGVAFILFDSHPRPPAEPSATLLVLSDAVGAGRHLLERVWAVEVGVLDSVDPEQALLYSLVDFTLLSLIPPRRPPPALLRSPPDQRQPRPPPWDPIGPTDKWPPALPDINAMRSRLVAMVAARGGEMAGNQIGQLYASFPNAAGAKQVLGRCGGVRGLCEGSPLEFNLDGSSGVIRLRGAAPGRPSVGTLATTAAVGAAAGAGAGRAAMAGAAAAGAGGSAAGAAETALHIFVDDSNIFLNAQRVLQPPAAEGAPPRVFVNRRVRLNVAALAARVQDGRRTVQRVVLGSVAAGAGSSVTAPHWKRCGFEVHEAQRPDGAGEQFVDDALIAQIQAKLGQFRDRGRTLVLLTGDGNGNSGRVSFVETVDRALQEGWAVELWSWRVCTSRRYEDYAREYAEPVCGRPRFVLRHLDDIRDEITWLAEPRGEAEARRAGLEETLARQRREREAHNALRRRHEAEDAAGLQILSESGAGDAERPGPLVRSESEDRLRKEKAEEERLAREEEETVRVIAALQRAEEDDLRSQQRVEESLVQQEAWARQEAEAERLRAEREGEEASLRLAMTLEMEGFTCESCRETLPLGDLFLPAKCACGDAARFCIECLRGWAESQISDQAQVPMMCPGKCAGGVLQQGELNNLVAQRMWIKYLMLERIQPMRDNPRYHQCPRPSADGLGCPGLVELDEGVANFVCPMPECGHRFCVRCNVDSGPGSQHAGTCAEYGRWRADNAVDPMGFLEGLGKDFLTCPGCRWPIEKVDGCNHMTCICNQHFCSLCGKNIDATRPYMHFNEPGATCSLFFVPREESAED